LAHPTVIECYTNFRNTQRKRNRDQEIDIDGLLNSGSAWSKRFSNKEDWSAWLTEGDETEEMQLLK
jgi:hypothetical protein